MPLLMKRLIGSIVYMGGVPAVLEEFCWSWGQLIQYTNEYLCKANEIVHLDRVKTSDHGPARNALAQRFYGDWLLMFDCDHAFEPDIATRLVTLMYENDLDVVTAVYHYKNPPHHLPVLYHWDEKNQHFGHIGNYRTDFPLFEVDCAGAGTLLIRRRVFDRIRHELKEEPFDRISPWSEDFSFFRRLERLGIKAHCAPQVESFHLTVTMLSSADRNTTGLQLTNVPGTAPVKAEEAVA